MDVLQGGAGGRVEGSEVDWLPICGGPCADAAVFAVCWLPARQAKCGESAGSGRGAIKDMRRRLLGVPRGDDDEGLLG